MARCKICRGEFTRRSMTHKCCSPDCAQEWARREREKAERKKTKTLLQKFKTRREYQNEAQAAVNAYVREFYRGMPCISCGNQNPKQFHAGHYLSRGAHPELALEPRNIFLQCSQCNDHLSGNQIEMRKGILKLKGQEELDWLEGPHEPKKYTIQDFQEIKAIYRKKLKELRDGNV